MDTLSAPAVEVADVFEMVATYPVALVAAPERETFSSPPEVKAVEVEVRERREPVVSTLAESAKGFCVVVVFQFQVCAKVALSMVLVADAAMSLLSAMPDALVTTGDHPVFVVDPEFLRYIVPLVESMARSPIDPVTDDSGVASVRKSWKSPAVLARVRMAAVFAPAELREVRPPMTDKVLPVARVVEPFSDMAPVPVEKVLAPVCENAPTWVCAPVKEDAPVMVRDPVWVMAPVEVSPTEVRSPESASTMSPVPSKVVANPPVVIVLAEDKAPLPLYRVLPVERVPEESGSVQVRAAVRSAEVNVPANRAAPPVTGAKIN